jgi:protein TonB
MRPHSGKEIVMQNGGFFERRKANSLGLGIIVAGRAALLTAIALNPTRFEPRIDFIPLVHNYRDPAPPPPSKPLPPQRPTLDPPAIRPVRPLVDSGPLIVSQIQLQPMPGSGPIAPPQLPSEPVIRQAVPDPAVTIDSSPITHRRWSAPASKGCPPSAC